MHILPVDSRDTVICVDRRARRVAGRRETWAKIFLKPPPHTFWLGCPSAEMVLLLFTVDDDVVSIYSRDGAVAACAAHVGCSICAAVESQPEPGAGRSLRDGTFLLDVPFRAEKSMSLVALGTLTWIGGAENRCSFSRSGTIVAGPCVSLFAHKAAFAWFCSAEGQDEEVLEVSVVALYAGVEVGMLALVGKRSPAWAVLRLVWVVVFAPW